MKNNFIKILFVIFTAIGILGFFSQAKAIVGPLSVEWSEDGNSWLPLQGPIFGETNFLPGQDVTRLVRVTNYSDATQRIAVEAINKNDPDNLGEKLNLVIKQGGTIIFNDTLKKFFDQGETYLSDLANGSTNQYDFMVSFASDTGDSFQEKTLGFDILVGFEGTEGGLPLPSPGGGTVGGGGGGWLPPGLTIQNEANINTTENSVTITWTTSYPATSQVIYGLEGEKHILDLTDTSGIPPKYGYERTTPESDISPKVTSHSVTIDGLTSGTTYYYRSVSHGSLAISEEHSFTTLGERVFVQPKEKEVAIAPLSVSVPAAPKALAEQPTTEQPIEQPVAQTAVPANISLVATIGGFLTLGTGSIWLGILVGLIILAIIVYAAYWLRKRKNSVSV